MKKFNVRVNGKTYAVEVEEVGGQGGFTYEPVQQPVQQQVVQPAPAPAPQAQVAPAPTPPAQAAPAPVSGDGELMSSPMPGTILDILVKEGQEIKRGDTVLILEAMKMENEIAAPVDGIVSKIHTSKSATVNAGDPLVTIG